MPRALSRSHRSLATHSHLGPSDLAVDLGTSNTRVYVPGVGVALDEPTVIAMSGNAVVAVGRTAKAMIGRVPESVQVITPLRRGVIADVSGARHMLAHFIKSVVGRWHVWQPRISVVVPYGTTQVEKRAVEELGRSVGARKVYLIEEPVAAALGAGLPVSEPGAHTIVNIGGGTTEVAVMSLSGIVGCESMRFGGDDLDEAIVQHVKKGHSLLIGPRQAEELKIATGSMLRAGNEADDASLILPVKGRNLINGLPKTIGVSIRELREALQEPTAALLEVVRSCLERIPPEVAADILDAGIVLTGGGALLTGLDAKLRARTHLPVRVSEQPSLCPVRGAGRALEEPTLLRAMSVSSS
jgi:rod shape-determining protein MreB and related proteins